MQAPNVEISTLSRVCNEVLVLSMLAGEMQHGYQLALGIEEQSGGYFRFNHGTLYPILHKLEHEGLIGGSWNHEGSKRKRKYYALTEEGRQYLASLEEHLIVFFRNFSHFLGRTAS